MTAVLTELDEHVLLITLNRPEKKNALNSEMFQGWYDALARARDDRQVRVVVLTGAGDAFCAGGDVTAMKSDDLKNDADDTDQNAIDSIVLRGALLVDELDKPVIAAVNGAAVGAGLGLALMADLRFMSRTARVSEGFINVGLFPGDGDTHFLPRIVGPSRALKMLWTGDFVHAEEAQAMGLADEVFEPDELMAKTMEFAHRLASRPQLAVRAIKRAVRASEYAPLRDSVSLVGGLFRLVAQSPERIATLDAFMAARKS